MKANIRLFRRISPQRVLIGGLILGLVLVAARIFALQGWIWPVRVVSGSMVEQLLGEHFTATCADCGLAFRFGVESAPPNEQAVCPNCGFASNPMRLAKRQRGDRVIIDRAAYLIDRPQRFDLVAFRDARQPARLVVKRVVGLPGEQMAIRHGDLYVNGKILRKSLADHRRMALFVHDNSFGPQPQEAVPARWRPDGAESGWRADGAEFRFVPPTVAVTDVVVTLRRDVAPDNVGLRSTSPATTTGSSEPVSSEADWLTYHHWRCFANPFPRSAEAPVADNYGYNQGESRELREVVDLMFSCRTTLAGDGELALRIHDGREWFTARLNGRERSVSLLRGEFQTAATTVPSGLMTDPLQIEFGLLDRQIVLAIGRREVIRQDYEPGEYPFQPLAHPISIGGLRNEIRIADIQLRRDVYYLDPWSVGQSWKMATPAGKNDYVVLGDNPPISDDSRKWPQPFLPADSILGRVIPYPR